MRHPWDVEWAIGTRDYRASLFPLALCFESYTSERANAAHLCLEHFAIAFEGNDVTFYILEQEWEQLARGFFRRVRTRPAVIENVLKDIPRSSNRLLGVARAIARRFTHRLSNRQLAECLHRYLEAHERVYFHGLVPTFLDFHDTTLLTEHLRAILQERGVPQEEIGVVFSLLTSPTRHWDFFDAEEALNAIARTILGRSPWYRLFSDTTAMVVARHLYAAPELRDTLEKYCRDYGWISYGYEGPSMTLHAVVDSLKDRLGSLFHNAPALLSNHDDVRRQQNEAMDQYRLRSGQRRWFAIAQDISFCKSYRRYVQSHSYALLEPILRQCAERSGITLAQWRMMLPEEALATIQGKHAPLDLSDRRQCCVLGATPAGRFFFTHDDARRFIEFTRLRSSIDEHLMIRGQIAYPGIVEGAALVIPSPDHLPDVSSGQIIISPSTNPQLMPAIRLCAALVTDAGGLTCHAAVVSRELKIPCIVGAKDATRRIATGDRIRVNANEGTITILQKAIGNQQKHVADCRLQIADC